MKKPSVAVEIKVSESGKSVLLTFAIDMVHSQTIVLNSIEANYLMNRLMEENKRLTKGV